MEINSLGEFKQHVKAIFPSITSDSFFEETSKTYIYDDLNRRITCRKDPCISSKRWFMSIPEGFDYGVSLESIVYGE